MTLYDYIKLTENSFDVADTEYDCSVTVDFIEKEEDNYDKFCNAIMKKVDFVKYIDDCIIVANWSELITRNFQKFREFSKKNWKYQYENDDEEFIYQWIKEIHLYMAGYVWEDFYGELIDFIATLE